MYLKGKSENCSVIDLKVKVLIIYYKLEFIIDRKYMIKYSVHTAVH